jgi:hypothetical protein
MGRWSFAPWARCPAHGPQSVWNLSLALRASFPRFPAFTAVPQRTPHRHPSVASPDTHRRLKLNLRCVSGEATEGIGRGWGGRLSLETSLLAESGLIRLIFPPFARGFPRELKPMQLIDWSGLDGGYSGACGWLLLETTPAPPASATPPALPSAPPGSSRPVATALALRRPGKPSARL